MRGFIAVGSVAFALALAGCSHSQPMAPRLADSASPVGIQSTQVAGSVESAGSVKGSGGQMPAFYDGKQITINTLQISDNAAAHVGTNPSHNEIFVTNDLDDEQDFFPVIDAIQGDGFNPMWEQIQIVFNPGVTPRQFVSDEEVLAAASGAHPEITLVDTHEVYRCSVVGKK